MGKHYLRIRSSEIARDGSKIEHQPESFKCLKCGEEFDKKYIINMHLIEKHPRSKNG